MQWRKRFRWARLLGGAGMLLCAGCVARHIQGPCGHLPPPTNCADVQTSGQLTAIEPAKPTPLPSPRPADTPTPAGKRPFELPAGLPGADAPQLTLPRFSRDTPPAEREKP